jgi:hypothetical protein
MIGLGYPVGPVLSQGGHSREKQAQAARDQAGLATSALLWGEPCWFQRAAWIL